MKCLLSALIILLLLLCLCACTKHSVDTLEVEKIIYTWGHGSINQYEMYEMMPDCCVKHYPIWQASNSNFDPFSGEVPSEDEYTVDEYQIAEESWDSLIEALTENDFMELPEEIPCKYPPCDVGYITITVITESGSHQSGGYSIGLDKGKKRDRFLNVVHVLDHISEAQIEPSQVQ